MLKEYLSDSGYAVGLKELLGYIEALLPSKEIITGAMRETETAYPSIALREAIANALIHQDFSITGTGVTIEIFNNRIEITNPGIPLVDVARIIDNPPKSRNEKLASLMRRLKMCEELGTGWDKIIISCELFKLPAPHIVLACYMHACIKYIQGEFLTNSSLRERFGLEEKSSASISRLIKDACNSNMIKKLEDTAPRHTKYVPIWA